MSAVLPKVKMFIFISLIILLINLCVCGVALAQQEIDYEDYLQQTRVDKYNNTKSPIQGENITLGDFAIATGGSFIPFFSLVPLALLDIETNTAIFIGLFIGLLSSIQLFLLIIIALNFIPKLFGSGVDV